MTSAYTIISLFKADYQVSATIYLDSVNSTNLHLILRRHAGWIDFPLKRNEKLPLFISPSDWSNAGLT